MIRNHPLQDVPGSAAPGHLSSAQGPHGHLGALHSPGTGTFYVGGTFHVLLRRGRGTFVACRRARTGTRSFRRNQPAMGIPCAESCERRCPRSAPDLAPAEWNSGLRFGPRRRPNGTAGPERRTPARACLTTSGPRGGSTEKVPTTITTGSAGVRGGGGGKSRIGPHYQARWFDKQFAFAAS